MRIESANSDKLTWLANQIFTGFPQEVTGLKFYALDCGCIYYQKVFPAGGLDSHIGIYRDAEDGACEVCMVQEETWKNRAIDEIVLYNSKLQIIIAPKSDMG